MIISDHNNNVRSKSNYPKEFKPSMYVDHLKKWSKLFGRDNLLILSYDEHNNTTPSNGASSKQEAGTGVNQ